MYLKWCLDIFTEKKYSLANNQQDLCKVLMAFLLFLCLYSINHSFNLGFSIAYPTGGDKEKTPGPQGDM